VSRQTCRKCQNVFPLTRKYFGSTPSGGFRRSCRSCQAAYTKEYDNATLERKRNAKERAARRSSTCFSASERAAVYHALIGRQNGCCFYCRKTLIGDNYHIDHMKPVVKGGSHTLGNLCLSCVQCNQEKHNKTVDEYRDWRRLNRLPILF
jgi:5-methylcytosine-specific restriction endonuclease McrA